MTLRDASRTELDLPPYPDPPPEERVHAQIMMDGRGQLQVLAPPAMLVELEPLRKLTGRPLRPLPYMHSEPIRAVPGLPGMTVIIDELLLDGPRWALATGVAGEYLRASGSELTIGLVDREVGRFSVRVDPHPTLRDRSGDRALIDGSVSRFTELRIRQRLDETLQIPPLTSSKRQIMALQGKPDCELREVVVAIESDPSFAARIVGWANSGFYAPRVAARSVGDAINRVLGIRTAVSMALGIALSGSLRVPQAHVGGAPPFWLEALLTAATMEALAHVSNLPGRPAPGDAYLIGLLANFGTLVISHVFPEHYAKICQLQEANRHLNRTHVDQHVLQMPREIIGAALLESWTLPASLTESVRFQHMFDYDGEFAKHVRLLRFARQLLDTEGLLELPESERGGDRPDDLGIRPERLASTIERLRSSREMLDGAAAFLPM